MSEERYRQIMESLGQPDSLSLYLALKQVANEVGQEVIARHTEMDQLVQRLIK